MSRGLVRGRGGGFVRGRGAGRGTGGRGGGGQRYMQIYALSYVRASSFVQMYVVTTYLGEGTSQSFWQGCLSSLRIRCISKPGIYSKEGPSNVRKNFLNNSPRPLPTCIPKSMYRTHFNSPSGYLISEMDTSLYLGFPKYGVIYSQSLHFTCLPLLNESYLFVKLKNVSYAMPVQKDSKRKFFSLTIEHSEEEEGPITCKLLFFSVDVCVFIASPYKNH